jgi:hypothetical protein
MFRQVCEGFEEERKMMEVKYSEIAKLLQQVRCPGSIKCSLALPIALPRP